MRSNQTRVAIFATLVSLSASALALTSSETGEPPQTPLFGVVDLDLGESQDVTLTDGETVTVKLLDIQEVRDSVRNAVRKATVRVEVAGQTVSLVSSTYRLPVAVGKVQIDCPVTQGYTQNSSKDNAWGLTKAARLRLWPADSPLVRPETFVYPAKQRWFASDTQMANVPCFVDGGELPSNKDIYYHYGLDFGGAEGLVEVIAATDGLVVSAADKTLPGYEDSPVQPRYDVIYVQDAQGWFYRYSHLHKIDEAVQPGVRVRMGQSLGLLGKEGASGGWSHLHFGISARQPSGLWGAVDGYPFIWEAYQRQYQPDITAVARPHCLSWAGEPVQLDATRSWSRSGEITKFEWTFCDETTATGPTVKRIYKKPGQYNEIVKITDTQGNVDYDFAVVQILDENHPDLLPPTIHAAYYPTFDIKPGDEVTFKVRSFRTTHGHETWDFGDGSPKVTVRSDGNIDAHNPKGYAVTKHRYCKPGHYIATVRRSNERGEPAITRLHICVEQD